MVAGLVGTIIPVLPGLLLVWAGGLIWALNETGTVRWIVLAVLTLLTVAGSLAKFFLSGRTAKARGAGAPIVFSALLGGVLGFFLIPLVGVLPGSALGILAGERIRLGNWQAARTSTKAVLLSYGAGMLVEFLTGLVMIGIWLAAVLTTTQGPVTGSVPHGTAERALWDSAAVQPGAQDRYAARDRRLT